MAAAKKPALVAGCFVSGIAAVVWNYGRTQFAPTPIKIQATVKSTDDRGRSSLQNIIDRRGGLPCPPASAPFLGGVLSTVLIVVGAVLVVFGGVVAVRKGRK